jgi:hypothetical protein
MSLIRSWFWPYLGSPGTVVTMNGVEYARWEQGVLRKLDALLRERYGRDGNALQTGYPVTLIEAGYATGGGWWTLQSTLANLTKSFQTEDLQTRLDFLFCDLLTHPDDAADRAWATRYGYASPSAATRAFRSRFRLTVRDIRAMGRLGRWLVLTDREARTADELARRQEARDRLRAFQRAGRKLALRRHSRQAIRALGATVPDATAARRPRYPPIGASEHRRLEDLGAL